MILEISTTHAPATDLGYLLHKNPGRVHCAETNFGNAIVFYPDATDERCTAVLMMEIDPVGLVRGSGVMDQYVNDRPYVASSFLCTALNQVYRTAMSGKCKDRPELVGTPIALEARIPVISCRGGEQFLRALFEPLGYEVIANRRPLDESFPEWGESRYFDLTVRATKRLAELLGHLYVLIPVLDDEKHYFIDEAEVEKLMRHGEGWLADHPAKPEIVARYLRRQSLTRQALERLERDVEEVDEAEAEHDAEELEKFEKPLSLHETRLDEVAKRIVDSGATSVVDLGCGEGKLIRKLRKEAKITRIVGMDVSVTALEYCHRKLGLANVSMREEGRISLIHGSLTYRDARLEGFDAASLVEVIEHLDQPRLRSLERVVFEFARPRVVIVTTPNAEYNAVYGMEKGTMRHRDHRFEWTREQFADWCQAISERFDYAMEIVPLGPIDEMHGAPSQMGVFRR